MALASADVGAIEAADTLPKARALASRLAGELGGATPQRAKEIKAALGVLRQAWPELEAAPKPAPAPAPAPSPAQPGPSPAPRPSPAQPGSARKTKTAPTSPRRTRGGAKPAARRAKGARATRAGRQIINEAAGHAAPAGQIVLVVLGATVAFAVFYAVIRNANNAPSGKAAIELMSDSATSLVRMIVASDVDPLDPKGTAGGIDPNGVAGPLGDAVGSAMDQLKKTQTSPPTHTHTPNGGTR